MNRMNDEFRMDSHKSPQQLEREIDATRAELLATLEELEHRLSPADLLNQFMGQARRHGGEFGGNLAQSLKDNPLPALLTSVGIAWMMAASNGRHHNGGAAMSGARMRRHGNGRMRQAGKRIRERMHDMRDSVRSRGEGAREGAAHAREGFEHAREGVVHARERMSGTADSMRQRARSMSSSARYRAYRARSGFSHLLEEQPLLLGAIGLAAGVIAGAALPPTEQEDRAFGPARDRALDRAKRAGAEGARQARERTEEAAKSAKAAMQGDSGSASGERTASGERMSGERPDVTSPGSTQTSTPGTGLGY